MTGNDLISDLKRGIISNLKRLDSELKLGLPHNNFKIDLNAGTILDVMDMIEKELTILVLYSSGIMNLTKKAAGEPENLPDQSIKTCRDLSLSECHKKEKLMSSSAWNLTRQGSEKANQSSH